MNGTDYNAQLASDIASFHWDPLGYCRYAFPWGVAGTALEREALRTWQAEQLDDIGRWLRDPETRHQPYLGVTASGHGIGKSTQVSMVLNWALDTCEDAKVVLTADTATQLKTKTQPEIAKWTRMCATSHWKEVSATSLKMKSESRENTWRADLIPWSEHNPEAFAGLHNKGRRVVVIFDEASAIADVIWETVTGALSDEGTEIIWLVYGNPTLNTGRFRECFGKFKHRWNWRRQVDSRTVEGTNKEQIQKDIDDFGEDSDFVRIRWRGEFPRVGSAQLISSEDVERARKYKSQGHEALPKILSVDVARFGDDQSIIGIRQGRKAEVLDKVRKFDTVSLSRMVIARIDSEQPDAVVVDGDGLGAAVVDYVRSAGYDVHEFRGGMPADDTRKYFNKRAEAWGQMGDWLKAGAEIPDDPELAADLVGPRYGFSAKQQIQLERKEDMKKRGLSSPDLGDMLAMTFDVKVNVKAPVNKKEYSYVFPGQMEQAWMGG